ncbi:MAG: GNAT family N-acetyltransferase [Planctomycetota bacterium]
MVAVRRAHNDDAAAVARVLNGVVAERRFTAMDVPVSADWVAEWITGLGPRSAMFVAEIGGEIVGFQTLAPFNPYVPSMRHVGDAGTQVAAEHRGQGVGRSLWEATRRFALVNGYEKVLIYVRRGNETALRFYRGLGFRDIGVAERQVKIDGAYEDELFLEWFA